MKTKGITIAKKLEQARHARLGHRADLLRRRAGAAALHDRPAGPGLHLPDAAVPGGAAVGRRRHARWAATASSTPPSTTRASARPSASRCSTTRSSISAWPSSRPRSRRCARWSIAPARNISPARTSPCWPRWPSSRPAACAARSPTPACNTGAAWAICGTARWRAAIATAAWARSAAAPTRSCCRSSPS